ncbi:ATP-binding protein [Fontivita pretiosa]|uniref:ATP-binding protein n=1 Tax=Fontivita pretiosa TaxID=2989684 RepID=UPI003D162BA4
MPSQKHTILVVDDEPDVVKSVQDLLRLEYRVLGCTRASEAMDILHREEVHVVMTDQRMPEMTGVELLRSVRGEHPDAIRLLFTGYADIRAVIDAINQGNVYRYITKPWDPDELEAIIREACDHYDLLVERKRLLAELQVKNAELWRANQQLTEANQLKQAFIQVASHELRTPLTILLGLSKLALRMDGGQDPLHDFLVRMDEAAGRLQRLIEQMISMLSAQRFEQVLDRRPENVAGLIRQAAEDVRPFIELRRQQLVVEVPEDLGVIEIDAMKIRDSINHLLLNAVKFTPDQGRITLSAGRQPAGVWIRVADTGTGIPPDCLPRLFEPFFTGYDVSHHSSGLYEFGRRGLGLGLSVVKAFVELHGGKVEVQSEPGRGSTFTIHLPDSKVSA